MNWLLGIAVVYVSYYTLMYARFIWKKEDNKLAGVAISLLAITILVLPIWMHFRK